MKNYYPKSFDALFVKKNDSNQYNLVFGKSTINKINNDDLIIKVFYS